MNKHRTHNREEKNHHSISCIWLTDTVWWHDHIPMNIEPTTNFFCSKRGHKKKFKNNKDVRAYKWLKIVLICWMNWLTIRKMARFIRCSLLFINLVQWKLWADHHQFCCYCFSFISNGSVGMTTDGHIRILSELWSRYTSVHWAYIWSIKVTFKSSYTERALNDSCWVINSAKVKTNLVRLQFASHCRFVCLFILRLLSSLPGHPAE